jgi:hypothetical protein
MTITSSFVSPPVLDWECTNVSSNAFKLSSGAFKRGLRDFTACHDAIRHQLPVPPFASRSQPIRRGPPNTYCCILRNRVSLSITSLLHPATLNHQLDLNSKDVSIKSIVQLEDEVNETDRGLYRARKGDMKGFEAVGSKATGTKRGATDDQVRCSKRQKTQAKSNQESEDISEREQVKDPHKDQVFRFMDLPGGKYNMDSAVYAYTNNLQNFATASTVMQQNMHIAA